jgi:geranylgeranyl pyrophosphate synthase/predicted secreted hydrolase
MQKSKNQESSDDERSRSPSIYDDELSAQILTIKVVNNKVVNDEGGSYTVYNITTDLSDGASWSVWRRFKDFQALHSEIKALRLPNRPALPEKKWIGNLDAKFVVKRSKDLEIYLADLLRCPNGQKLFPLRNILQPALRKDWPSAIGPINLLVHDGPHESSITEWWYYNSHVTTTDGTELSIFAAFFRICKHVDAKTGKKSYAHALNWAITDVKNNTYTTDILLDRDSPAMVLKQMEEGSKMVGDKKLREAMKEVLAKGNVPLPDRMFKKDASVPFGTLNLDYENASVTKRSDGAYVVNAVASNGKKDSGFNLVFVPKKPAVRHGKDGVVAGHDGDDMFYYFIPRCVVEGTVTLGGVEQQISKGQGWYDHEFGGAFPEEGKDRMDYAWNWAAVQLDNNFDITAATLVNPDTSAVMETRTVFVDPSGRRTKYDDMELIGTEMWSSVTTFRTFPTAWNLKIPSADTDLMLVAEFPDQEFITLIAKPSYWEGRCKVSGTFRGEKVTGLAYVERNGFDRMPSLPSFFKNVGVQVRKSVQDMYPDKPTHDQVRDLIATKDTDYYMKGVPLDVLQQTLMAPVRLIADRGGKSWRSYGALACCDVVGGDSRQFVKWLAMPEFMHVGSLIVDDIQDKSEERRGGKCAHHIYGEPLCINAGTAAYFMCEHLIKAPNLTAEQLNSVYQLYFSCLRGGHAGQALDIHGLDYLMPDAIEQGKSSLLEERSLAIHMLKTAVPAGTLARMGALVGGGTPEQIEAVGKYFEGVGLAFQIMDDVLNLRGLFFDSKIDQSLDMDKKDQSATANIVTEIFGREDQKVKFKAEQESKKSKALKVVGEDIMCGKVTMPVAKAMSRMNKPQRAALWSVIESKPQDQDVVNKVIQDLEDCGAIEACVVHANRLVEESWAAMDPIVPDSFAKMMLRSFGWFVVRR